MGISFILPLLSKHRVVKKHFELILLVAVIGFVSVAKTQDKVTAPYVILISLDGFRHDYVEKFDAPNLKRLISQGVSAEAMLPSYPSKTFPNHYTIVTGLYPDHHGLVDNSFYDRNLDIQYSIRDRSAVENTAFYGGTPLWQLVQQNGMKSASYFWVGSETPVTGSYPDYYHIYDDNVANETRINAAIDWLNLPEAERPHFTTLYFSLVDSQGHATGPNADETKQVVLEADRLIGLLMEKLKTVDLPVNVIITSDHGMNEITPKEESYLTVSDLLKDFDKEKFRFVSNGAHGHFYSDDRAYLEQIAKQLKARNDSDNFEVFFKSEMPAHWNYGTHDRVGDLFIKINPGHYLSSSARKQRAITNQEFRGEHGFDPDETDDMGAIFYAYGPNFKSGLTIGKFRNIHVYPMIAKVLGITQLPEIDGDLKVLESIIKD
nr:ectonucleotide pyrophosphatase/phosphodiesterase [Roseivirga sp. E12]